MNEKFQIGDKELMIVFGDGIYHVLEAKEEYDVVFTCNYEECLEYCEKTKIIAEQNSIA